MFRGYCSGFLRPDRERGFGQPGPQHLEHLWTTGGATQELHKNSQGLVLQQEDLGNPTPKQDPIANHDMSHKLKRSSKGVIL